MAESRIEHRLKLRDLIGILTFESQSLEVQRSSGSDTTADSETSKDPGSNAKHLF